MCPVCLSEGFLVDVFSCFYFVLFYLLLFLYLLSFLDIFGIKVSGELTKFFV